MGGADAGIQRHSPHLDLNRLDGSDDQRSAITWLRVCAQAFAHGSQAAVCRRTPAVARSNPTVAVRAAFNQRESCATGAAVAARASGWQLTAFGSIQAVALQGIQDEHHPPVAHDCGALKLLAFRQSASQRLD